MGALILIRLYGFYEKMFGINKWLKDRRDQIMWLLQFQLEFEGFIFGLQKLC